MSAPSTMAEFERRYLENYEVTDYGIDAANHFPCPFCAAKDWYVVRIVDFAQTSPSMTCAECGRSGQLLYSEQNGETRMEIVQTGGEDPPDWCYPPIRRI